MKNILLLVFFLFLSRSLLSYASEPFYVSGTIYSPDETCVYYKISSSGIIISCSTVREDRVDGGWYHRYGDVICSYKCSKCTQMNLISYIYDKYNERWVQFNGWYRQTIFESDYESLKSSLSDHLITGDINAYSCSPKIRCGQTSGYSIAKRIDSTIYGDNTCVYYTYGVSSTGAGGIVYRNNVMDGGWYPRYGDVSCYRGCNLGYHLTLYTYVYNRNTSSWVQKSGWSWQKIKVEDGCELLESIKRHKRPSGQDLDTLQCIQYDNTNCEEEYQKLIKDCRGEINIEKFDSLTCKGSCKADTESNEGSSCL